MSRGLWNCANGGSLGDRVNPRRKRLSSPARLEVLTTASPPLREKTTATIKVIASPRRNSKRSCGETWGLRELLETRYKQVLKPEMTEHLGGSGTSGPKSDPATATAT